MTARDEIDPAHIASSIEASFKPEVIREVLTGAFADTKTKLSAEALALVCEASRLLAAEGALRASAHALRDASPTVQVQHVEKCLPQLMLDFP